MGLLEESQAMRDVWGERSGRLTDDMEKFSNGTISGPQMALRTAGETAGGVGDAVGQVLSATLGWTVPQILVDGLKEVVQGISATGAAKAAEAWMKKHPEEARDAMSVLNVGGLIGGGAAVKGGITALAHNAPNQLKGFYGNGLLGQAGSVAAGIPSTAMHALKDVLTPSGQAGLREGVPSRLKAVAKEQGANMAAGKDFNKSASFLEGQLDQSSLLYHGADKPAPFLDETFRPMQDIDAGPMTKDRMKAGMEGYKPDQYGTDSGIDEGLLGKFHDRMRDSSKMKPGEDVVMVTRHPTALGDLIPESTGGAQASKTAKALFRGKAALGKYFPDKAGFDSMDELREFVAVRSLSDGTLVKAKTGQKLNAVDRAINKVMGPGPKDNPRYTPRESGYANIDTYYKFKKTVADGPQFTDAELATMAKYKARQEAGKPLSQAAKDKMEAFARRETYGKLTPSQVDKYKQLQQRVYKATQNMEVDAQNGRVYTRTSHKSAAKGLGGVGDEFAIDLKGNVTHMINDENDLFGLKLPGDKRVLSVTPPKNYNLFKAESNPADAAGKAKKLAHTEMLAAKHGATNYGTKNVNIVRQIGEAIDNYKPNVTGADRANALKAGARGGLLGIWGYNEANK